MSRDVMYMWHVPDPFIGALVVTFEGVCGSWVLQVESLKPFIGVTNQVVTNG